MLNMSGLPCAWGRSFNTQAAHNACLQCCQEECRCRIEPTCTSSITSILAEDPKELGQCLGIFVLP